MSRRRCLRTNELMSMMLFSLEDLFVKEEYRGQGIAKTLFSYLGQVANEKDCPRMDWVVIDWNEVRLFFPS